MTTNLAPLFLKRRSKKEKVDNKQVFLLVVATQKGALKRF